MKPVLVAVAAALVAILLSAIAVSREQRARQDLERRIAVLEAERASPEPRPTPAPEVRFTGSPTPDEPVVPVPPGKTEASSDDGARLRKLEEQVARMEARLRELNRAAEGAAVEDVAGLSADQVWQKAQMALQDKLTGRADAIFREFLKRFPGDPRIAEALSSVAWSEWTAGNPDGALAAYARILSEFPESRQVAQAEFYTGMIYADAGNLAGAKEHYERSVEKFTDKPYWQAAALLNLGDAYAARGQPEVAKEYWRRVSTQYAADPQASKLAKAADEKLQAVDKK